jgi:exonuclease III
METPDIVLLQETKCASEDIDRLLPYCWRQGRAASIDATGMAGGLTILWNTNVVLMENFFTTKWSITADYRIIGSNKPGHLTNVYGPATPRDKQAFLKSLSYLSSLTQHNRWIVGGDFNIIRSLEEKKGGSRRLDQESSDFNGLIDDLHLIDLEAGNDTYTWTNRRTGIHQIACKLDRFLISETIMMEGTTMESTIMNLSGSDHWPIQLWLDVPATTGKKPFRFEQFWLDHPDFQANIQNWWREAEIPHGSKMYKFQQKLKNLKQTLKLWNMHTFGNIFESQKKLLAQMDEIQQQIRDQGLTEELKAQEMEVTQQMEARKKQEEILWKQKSRVQWLKEGERNTKFFHRTVIQRRHSNKITHLISDEGETIHSHADMEKTLLEYFQGLLTEPIQDRQEAINKVTRHVPSLVTQEQNAALLRPFTIEEVDQALQETPSARLLGPTASPVTSSTTVGR